MPNSLENQFIADTFKTLLHTGDVSLSAGAPDAKLYSGDGFESSLTVSTVSNGIKVSGDSTIYGNVISNGDGIFFGSLSSGSNTVTGDSRISGSVDVAGGIKVGGSLSSGSHTVTGNSKISGTTTIGGSLSSGSHIISGDSRISGSVDVAGGIKVGGSLSSGSHTVTGNSNINGTTTIGGSLSSGSHTVTGNSRITNRIDTNVIYANTYLNLPTSLSPESIVDYIYPIGSIFLSFTNTNPSIRFTGTVWTQVSQGRFIAGVGTGNDGIQNKIFTAGNNAGEYQHKLTVNEMPSHNHNSTSNYGLVRRSNANEETPSVSDKIGSGIEMFVWSDVRTIDSNGGDGYHNNTPPGFGLYVWQRTL